MPSALPMFEKIQRLEHFLLELPQVETPVTHDFCEGLYSRTMFIPKGTVLTGAIHRSENFMFIRSGDITVWTEEGMKRVQGGFMTKSFEGAKRVGYAHEDTLLTTVHFNPTNETNPEELWNLFTVESLAQLDEDKLKNIEVML